MGFDRYHILHQIALGGMSEVFLARPLESRGAGDEVVVIKRILPQLAREPAFVELFEEEARVSRLMHHANVVRTLDAGSVDGQPYIVMEYVDGVDCWKMAQRCVTRGSPPSVEASVFIICEVLRALAHVHLATDELGMVMRLVHGDVSPTNILLSRTGEVKLGDFGIARARQTESPELKEMVQGKVDYLAPEQVRGGKIDHRADLFSAATVLAELLVREHLFRRDAQLSTLLAIRDAELEVLDRNADKLPPGLDAVLRRALSRDAEARYTTASSMNRALTQFLSSRTEQDLRAEIAALVETASDPEPAESSSRTATPPDIPPYERPTPVIEAEQTLDVAAEASPPLLRPTPVNFTAEYIFRSPHGETTEPMIYAGAVECVLAGMFVSSHEVSINGEPFVPITEVRSLARHLPPPTPATAEINSVGPPDRRALLHDQPIWQVLFEVAVAHETGLAIFHRGSDRKEVFFTNGDPRSVASNISSELLGRYLVERGVISRRQLDLALDAMPAYTGHLGETLIGMRLIEPVTLFQLISEQVEERILDLFAWEQGEFAFYRDASERETTFPLDLQTLHLLWPGIKRAVTPEAAQSWLDEHRRWLIRRSPSARVELHRLGLPDGIELSLSLIRGPVQVGQVIQAMTRRVEAPEAALALVLTTDLSLFELAPTSSDLLTAPEDV